jgi:hypothetical protein
MQLLINRPRTATWARPAVGLVALCLIAALALIGWAAATGRLKTLDGENTPTPQPITGRGPQVFDLKRPLLEKTWIGYQPSPPARFNADQRMLELRSDSYQLIEIGQYDGQPGVFEVTIRQIPWHGDAGLYFGYRTQPRQKFPKQKQLYSTFQLIWLHHFPLVDGQGREYGERMEAMRQRTIFGDEEEPFIREAAIGRQVPLPGATDARLTVQFGRLGCERIAVNGVAVEDLTSLAINQKYDVIDYQGTWGLYSARGYGPKEATWFGNLSFTPLEK